VRLSNEYQVSCSSGGGKCLQCPGGGEVGLKLWGVEATNVVLQAGGGSMSHASVRVFVVKVLRRGGAGNYSGQGLDIKRPGEAGEGDRRRVGCNGDG